ncbi:MAG: hypothetical protein BWK79_01710 [Beggiatoa sp. IS2]|nr:MAG: hypothetical protein BWK79_01710 [Beggiatoa sp. IS2]
MLPELVWKKRPFEIRNLLNPAFCAVLLHKAVKTYCEESKQNMPYPLVFLVLPLIFPKKIRDTLPKRVDKSFNDWIQENSLNLLDFDQIIRFLCPYTKEAIIFAMQFHCLEIEKDGHISYDYLSKPTIIWNNDSESVDCYKEAKFLGYWFAHTGTTAIIFKSLGVRL